ncbi:MAG: ABC transporter substrate-binding protein [Victivallaceae bacterium]
MEYFKRTVSLGLIALGLFIIAGCKTPPTPDPVRIGVILPMSGEFAPYGKKLFAGIKLKADELNNEGGIDCRRVELVLADNESSVSKTAVALRKIAEQKIFIVIGGYTSADAFALKPDALKYKVTVIAPMATNDLVTERNPYIFRTCFSDSFQGKAIGRFAVEKMQLDKIGVMLNIDENGTYSRDLGRSTADGINTAGGKVAIVEGYYRKSTTYVPQLKKIMDADVNGIFIPSYPEEAAKMINESRKLGYQGYIFGGDGWDEDDFFKQLGATPGPCFFASMFSARYDSPETRHFLEKFHAETGGKSPGVCEAQGYDTMSIVAEAVRNSIFDYDIRAALYNIKDYPGVTGRITIDSNRNAIKSLFIKEVIKKADGFFGPRLIAVIDPVTERKRKEQNSEDL